MEGCATCRAALLTRVSKPPNCMTAAATGRDWLGQILDHHEAIDAAFAAVKAAGDVNSRRAALTELSILLSAHANAEEAVIYPALVHFGHKDHGMAGYGEQAGRRLTSVSWSIRTPWVWSSRTSWSSFVERSRIMSLR